MHSVMPDPILALSSCKPMNNGRDDDDLNLLNIFGYLYFDHPSTLPSTATSLLSLHVSAV